MAEAHDGLVPWGALLAAGVPRSTAADLLARLRRVHDGVGLTGHGRITRNQRHLAATLTTPASALSFASAGDRHGFRPWNGGFEVITRPGTGGPRRIGDLLVCRSPDVADHVVFVDGIRVTSAARTLADLGAHLDRRSRDRAVREAIRLGCLTALELRLHLAASPGRRGIAGLDALAGLLEGLPIARTRSLAEARALEVLHAGGREIPAVNVRIGGEEADLVWWATRRILELDGPQFHRDVVEDARKQAVWEREGFEVHRRSTDLVFDSPAELVALAGELERPWSPGLPDSLDAR